MSRKLAISDIHGHAKTLESLLDRIAFTQADELFLLGDYIDRGPDSKGVIDLIRRLQATGYQVHALRGNHEQMMLAHRREPCIEPGMSYMDAPTLASFGAKDILEIDQSYFDWLEKLPHFLEIDGFLLAHAGLNFGPESPGPDLDLKSMLWIRDWYHTIDRAWLEGRIIIHGHSPVKSQVIDWFFQKMDIMQVLNIDNGCFQRNSEGFGSLCCLDMTNRRICFQSNVEVPIADF